MDGWNRRKRRYEDSKDCWKLATIRGFEAKVMRSFIVGGMENVGAIDRIRVIILLSISELKYRNLLAICFWANQLLYVRVFMKDSCGLLTLKIMARTK